MSLKNAVTCRFWNSRSSLTEGAGPAHVDFRGPAVGERARLQVELGGGVHEVVDVRMVLRPDEGDEVDHVRQPQLRRKFPGDVG